MSDEAVVESKPEETKPEEREFNPNRHMMDLKGKQYLPVAARIAWFRDDHPIEEGWAIHTECIAGSYTEDYAVFRTSIVSPEGKVIATATKTEDKRGFPEFMEKAEAGSIGRALSYCGYGTLYAQELEEGGDKVVDTPQPRRGGAPQWRDGGPKPPARPAPTRQQVTEVFGEAPPEPGPFDDTPEEHVPEKKPEGGACSVCARKMTAGQVEFTKRKWGRLLCSLHQESEKKAAQG